MPKNPFENFDNDKVVPIERGHEIRRQQIIERAEKAGNDPAVEFYINEAQKLLQNTLRHSPQDRSKYAQALQKRIDMSVITRDFSERELNLLRAVQRKLTDIFLEN